MSNIELAMKAVSEGGYIDNVDPKELREIVEQTDIDPRDMPLVAGTMVYIRKRFIERAGRVEAFRAAFPERCKPDPNANTPYPSTNENSISDTSIKIKAKRLENRAIYKKIVTLLQTSLYTMFALERIEVLDNLFERIPRANNKDAATLAKVFLEETRKPEASGMELNVNVLNNNVSVVTIEEKMGRIADKLEGKSADKIIEALNVSNT